MTSKQPSLLTRSTVANLTGINPETLRYYEREGLLEAPRRSAAGYRLYGEEDLKRLKFVCRSKELGFSLGDIREFVSLTANLATPRQELRNLAMDRLAVIQEKIRDLQAMEKTLAALVHDCDGLGPVKGCPIAEFLVEGKNSADTERTSS